MSELIDYPEAGVALFGALAHPIRLRLLRELCVEEECVCHLAALLDKPQPYISQQLAELRQAGLVLDRRDGQRIYYRLIDERVSALLESAAAVLGEGMPSKRQRQKVPGCSCPKCAIYAGD